MVKYHFIAIGGIGMSGLAKYLIECGESVSGSDICDSKYVDKLRQLGAIVNIGHSESNIKGDENCIVVSTAIRENNPELVKAKQLGLKIYHRSDLLKEITDRAKSEGKIFIGFSGTHGKTTTSGLASYVLEKAGLTPSYVDGGIIPDINTNAKYQNGNYFIAELDESDGTITKYNPDILVVNNLEEDHLDFYKNGMKDLIKTFNTAISNSKKVIINADNAGTLKLNGSFITFGLNEADYVAKNIEYTKEYTIFDIFYKNVLLASGLKIQLAGVHNVYNALGVVSALNEAGIEISDAIRTAFYDFSGMGRRFQKICEFNGIKVYDDYAHHPTEIKATLESASQKFGKENIVAVFQPHRYTRLKTLWNEFLNSFNNAQRVIVTDVYSASEDEIAGISGKAFSNELPNSEYIGGTVEEVAKKLLPTLNSNNIVIGLGAGTITSLGKNLEKFSQNITRI